MPSAHSATPRALVLMGVAGSGKTTIGRQLAVELGWTFRDADDFHPPANVAKMAAGTPLTDADREPWLRALRDCIDTSLTRGESVVIACSALREAYRRILTAGRNDAAVVYLYGDYDLILSRLQQRQGHFMPPTMLESQFATLEPPQHALTVSIDAPPATIVANIRSALSL